MKKLLISGAMALAMTVSAHAANVVQTAASTGKFETLIAAAKAAGLAGALSNTHDITVFAPTDEAFAKLPAGTVKNLLKPENKDKLAAILKYHVVPARVPSSAAQVKSARIETLKQEGDSTIRVRKRFGNVYVDRAKVVSPDIQASNGIIHVIDKVLLPTF